MPAAFRVISAKPCFGIAGERPGLLNHDRPVPELPASARALRRGAIKRDAALNEWAEKLVDLERFIGRVRDEDFERDRLDGARNRSQTSKWITAPAF